MKRIFSIAFIAVAILLMPVFCVAQSTKVFEEYETEDMPNDPRFEGELNGHQYVDLGLPSGTKWATCNIDAYFPEDYGGYFMWGQPKDPHKFNESYCKTYDRSVQSLQYDGYLDTNCYLTKLSDIAYIKWGEGWSLPTVAQIEELLDEKNCYWESAKLNGVKGYMIYSKANLNHIFLPSAGYKSDSKVRGEDSDGKYWSCEPELKNNRCAIALEIDTYYQSKKPNTRIQGREYGFSIRPVTLK